MSLRRDGKLNFPPPLTKRMGEGEPADVPSEALRGRRVGAIRDEGLRRKSWGELYEAEIVGNLLRGQRAAAAEEVEGTGGGSRVEGGGSRQDTRVVVVCWMESDGSCPDAPELKTVFAPQTPSKTMSPDDDDEQIDWGFDDDDEDDVAQPAVVPPADEVAHPPAPNPAAPSPARAPATPSAAADVGSPSQVKQVESSPSTATVVGPRDGSQRESSAELEGLVNTHF